MSGQNRRVANALRPPNPKRRGGASEGGLPIHTVNIVFLHLNRAVKLYHRRLNAGYLGIIHQNQANVIFSSSGNRVGHEVLACRLHFGNGDQSLQLIAVQIPVETIATE